MSTNALADSTWSTGPGFLLCPAEGFASDFFSLLDHDKNSQIYPEVNSNLQSGHFFLVKNQHAEGITWPMRLTPSNDGKVELKVTRQGTVKAFIRPTTVLVLLLPLGTELYMLDGEIFMTPSRRICQELLAPLSVGLYDTPLQLIQS